MDKGVEFHQWAHQGIRSVKWRQHSKSFTLTCSWVLTWREYDYGDYIKCVGSIDGSLGENTGVPLGIF